MALPPVCRFLEPGTGLRRVDVLPAQQGNPGHLPAALPRGRRGKLPGVSPAGAAGSREAPACPPRAARGSEASARVAQAASRGWDENRMTVPRFLLDEDSPPWLARFLWRQEPALDIVYVGGPNAPPRRTPDRALLLFAEAEQRALITQDRNTMPGHARDHLAAGHHTWRVVILREGFPPRDYADAIILIWAASQAEEWQDRIEFIP